MVASELQSPLATAMQGPAVSRQQSSAPALSNQRPLFSDITNRNPVTSRPPAIELRATAIEESGGLCGSRWAGELRGLPGKRAASPEMLTHAVFDVV